MDRRKEGLTLMNWPLFAALLIVAQAAPPAIGMAINNSAQTAQHVEDQGKTDERKPTPAGTGGRTQGDVEDGGAKDHSYTVRVRELPPVSTTRNWADWGYWIFSGMLVVVGSLQVWLLLRTWKATERQARLLEFSQQQWAELGNWKTSEDKDERSENRRVINCTFDVLNKTSLPFILRKVQTDVVPMRLGGEGPQPGPAPSGCYEVTEHLLLLPKGAGGSRYTCMVPVTVERQDIPSYLRFNLFVFFMVKVFFVGADGTERPQDFKQAAMLGPDKIELWAAGGAVPDERGSSYRLRPYRPEPDQD
jgi:hypothetical protein